MRPALIALVVAAGLAVVPAASAAGVLAHAAAELRTEPVYVDPRVPEHLTPAEVRRVEREIASSRSGPVYVAVLPLAAENESGGDPAEALRTIALSVGRSGVYAAIIGKHFRAGATQGVLPQGEAGQLATDALNAHRSDGVAAVLVDFVDRVAAARNGGGGNGGSSSIPWWPLILFGGVALFIFSRARRSRRVNAAELADVRAAAKEDLVALADDVQRLEHRVEGNKDAQAAYDKAISSYGQASDTFDRARSPQELSAGRRGDRRRPLRDGGRRGGACREEATRAHVALFLRPAARAVVARGRVGAPGGTPRLVPACEADAQRVERGSSRSRAR